MAPTPNSALLAAHLREDTADLLALLPAARRAAAGGPGGGEATLDGIARAAYRTLRTAENLAAHAALCTAPPHPQPVCVTALAAAYVSGAAGVLHFLSNLIGIHTPYGRSVDRPYANYSQHSRKTKISHFYGGFACRHEKAAAPGHGAAAFPARHSGSSRCATAK